MVAGKLRQRLVIETPTRNRDEYGENLPTYAPLATVWCSIKPLRGQQLALAQQSSITATATHEIRMRYRDLKIGFHRLKFGGATSSDYLAMAETTFDALSESDFLTLPEVATATTPARYFFVNSIGNTDERNIELVLTATEDKQ